MYLLADIPKKEEKKLSISNHHAAAVNCKILSEQWSNNYIIKSNKNIFAAQIIVQMHLNMHNVPNIYLLNNYVK